VRSSEEQVDLFNWFVKLFNLGELKLPSLGLPKVVWDSSDTDTAAKVLVEGVQRAQAGTLGQRKQIIIFQ
jgi:trans-2-enoyl-CoA reductase